MMMMMMMGAAVMTDGDVRQLKIKVIYEKIDAHFTCSVITIHTLRPFWSTVRNT